MTEIKMMNVHFETSFELSGNGKMWRERSREALEKMKRK